MAFCLKSQIYLWLFVYCYSAQIECSTMSTKYSEHHYKAFQTQQLHYPILASELHKNALKFTFIQINLNYNKISFTGDRVRK